MTLIATYNPELNRKLSKRQELIRGLLLGTGLAVAAIAALRPMTQTQVLRSDARASHHATASLAPAR